MDGRITDDLKKSYGITCGRTSPVTGGLLNRKWKVSADSGEFLVKQYSLKRFRREQIEKIESALQRQILLEKLGVPCPSLRRCGSRVIRWLNDQTAYMVMDFRAGKTEGSGTVTPAQMRSLGGTCAVMHRAFSQLPEPPVRDLPVFGGYSADLLREYFSSRMKENPSGTPDGYRKALSAAEPILKRIDARFFGRFSKGFAHEDFHAGNILFDTDRVSSVVDFDRNCRSYVRHDIGRAILSFALEDGGMNVGKVCAFLEGYARHLPLTLPDIADALRLSWCIEAPWWIRPEFFGECDETPRRFRDEMLWLSAHWFDLDSVLSVP